MIAGIGLPAHDAPLGEQAAVPPAPVCARHCRARRSAARAAARRARSRAGARHPGCAAPDRDGWCEVVGLRLAWLGSRRTDVGLHWFGRSPAQAQSARFLPSVDKLWIDVLFFCNSTVSAIGEQKDRRNRIGQRHAVAGLVQQMNSTINRNGSLPMTATSLAAPCAQGIFNRSRPCRWRCRRRLLAADLVISNWDGYMAPRTCPTASRRRPASTSKSWCTPPMKRSWAS